MRCSLPDLQELPRQLYFIARESAVLGLFATGALVVLVRDWRVTLLALLAQYVMVGVVLSRLVLPEMAIIKVLIGALICSMLYLAARQSGWSQLSLPELLVRSPHRGYSDCRGPSMFSAGLSFRVLAVTLVLALAIVINQAYPLSGVPADVGLACHWLILAGCLTLMLTEEPLKAGPGLLTAIAGFDLLYSPLEPSLVVAFLWAVVNLSLAVAIAYLAVARAGGAAGRDP